MVIVIRAAVWEGGCVGCHDTVASAVSGTGRYSQLICFSYSPQVPRPLAMKKESIQTRKRKPKMPKNKASTGRRETLSEMHTVITRATQTHHKSEAVLQEKL